MKFFTNEATEPEADTGKEKLAWNEMQKNRYR